MSLMRMRGRIRKEHWASQAFRGRASWGSVIACFAVSAYAAMVSIRAMQVDSLRVGGLLVSIVLGIAGVSQWRRLKKMPKRASSAPQSRQR